jgi:predicted DNA-binding transcriptional regulator YafY
VQALGAWCELRLGFMSFRVDLIQEAKLLETRLEPTDKRSPQAYVDY